MKDAPDVTDGDLAEAEDRVSRLGILLDCVDKTVLRLGNAALTLDAILVEVVKLAGEFGTAGAIRKSSNPEKTVAMIKVLAKLCHVNAALTEAQKWDAVRVFNVTGR